MKRFRLPAFILIISAQLFSQNDLDVIRYSRSGTGGTARFTAMGGAMGALGADLSCSAFNPAGLGIFRKSEISFGAGLRLQNNTATLYRNSIPISDAKFVFNNFGIVLAWGSEKDPEDRHVFAFSNTQLQNYFNSTRLSGYTNNSSIAKDMLNLANERKTAASLTGNLNADYEWLGFRTYLIDTADNKFFSFVDTKRSVKQTRDVVNSGKMNDLNFSYAYSMNDKYYFGVSLSFPQIDYQSSTIHTESDDRDSMRITLLTDSTYSTTYYEEPPVIYKDKLGFNNLTYEEFYTTTGGGVNLKIGGIARLNEMIRVGLYYHTPTIYRLTDEYYNSLSVSYDANPSGPIAVTEPADGGYFKYRMITPGRIGTNLAFIFKKAGSVALDYELVNYAKGRLSSDDISDFAGVNAVIGKKYKAGHNVRLGGELNLSPFMVRAGYSMYGSPFGAAFSGEFVRHTISAGAGFRKNNFYVDVVFSKNISTENYYLFTTLNTSGKIEYGSNQIGATFGFKF